MSERERTLEKLLSAAKLHVPFDGWGDETFNACCSDAGLDPQIARLYCPRAGLDLAIYYHRSIDKYLIEKNELQELGDSKLRDKVAKVIQNRLELVEDKELVRRATTLFALPHNNLTGLKLIWETSDTIWKIVGDTSTDINWYTKRMTLSVVYGAVVLFWLGDNSSENEKTWEFLDRRLADVMGFEKFKSAVRANPVLKPLNDFFIKSATGIKAPVNHASSRPGNFR
jgi:ubiquinone biosynthesis protein COQ9